MTISQVRSGETVTLTLTVAGTSAAAESERHSSEDHQIPINGTVENLTGSAPGFQFFVNDRLTRGDDMTEFFGNDHRDTFADLNNGDRVEVKALERDGYLYAVRIHINGEDDDADDHDDSDLLNKTGLKVEVKGTPSGPVGPHTRSQT